MANIFYLPLHVVLEGPKFRVPFSGAASSKKDIFVCSIGWVSEVAQKLFEIAVLLAPSLLGRG